jgi:hypothetical protein
MMATGKQLHAALATRDAVAMDLADFADWKARDDRAWADADHAQWLAQTFYAGMKPQVHDGRKWWVRDDRRAA